MKTPLLLCLLAFAGVQAISERVNAQTSINIQYFQDSLLQNGYCPPPANPWFYMYGQATGYNPNDPMNVEVDFGDGNTYSNTVLLSSGSFADYPYHTYNFSGMFLVRCIVTGPDANADTAYHQIVVGDTCGNINGKLYIDANNDCAYNTGETMLAGIPVLLKQNNNVIATSYTDATGDYAFSAPGTFTYDIVPALNIFNYGYSVTCPASGQHTNVAVPANGMDFGVICQPGFDLQAFLYGWGFRPGFNGYLDPYALNTYCQPMNGQLELILDPLTNYVSANPAPASISGDTLRWNFSNLSNANYWWNWNSFYPEVVVNTDLTAQIGDSVCFTTNVTPAAGDVNTANNTYYKCYAVSNSWDPNIKEVSPTGTGPNGDLPVGMHTMNYTVQFQNTGNDTAFNIFILDTIDADLDINTFQAITASHQMEVDILSGNVVKFSFNNIMLVDSTMNEPLSHGQVTYTIRTKANLPIGTQIANTAHIYFDFNPAIVTNTTLNTISMLSSVSEISSDNFVSIYPNPASTKVLVMLTEKQVGADIILINALGQVVLKEKAKQKEVNINTSNLPAGIYHLNLMEGENIISRKLVLIK